jgi:hypothetical protein
MMVSFSGLFFHQINFNGQQLDSFDTELRVYR